MSKQSVNEACCKFGFVFEDHGSYLSLEAPSGHVFSGTQTHEVIADYKTSVKSEAYKSLLDDIRNGIEKCEIPDCEWCNEQ
jgi:hypothetical protein